MIFSSGYNTIVVREFIDIKKQNLLVEIKENIYFQQITDYLNTLIHVFFDRCVHFICKCFLDVNLGTFKTQIA